MRRKIKDIMGKNSDAVSLEMAYQQYIKKFTICFGGSNRPYRNFFSYKANSHIKYSVGEFT
jgi:hypothetical protein